MTHPGQSRLSLVDWLVAAGLLALAFAIRAYGLGEWAFEGDEFFTIWNFAERAQSINNPAYYQLMVVTDKLLGLNELTARLPAAIFGIAAIPALYLSWRTFAGRETAFVAALLLAICGWHLLFSQYSRFYTGVVFFSILSQYGYLRVLRDNSLWWLAFSVVCGVTAFLFHATAVLVLGTSLATSVIIALMRKRQGQPVGRAIGAHLIVFGIAGLAVLPFFLGILTSWGARGRNWGYPPATFLLQLIKYFGPVITVAALFGLIRTHRENVERSLFLFISAGLPIVVVLLGSVFFAVRPDYVIYILPLVLIMAAQFATGGAIERHPVMTSTGIAAILFLSMLPETVSYFTSKQSLDFRQAVSRVESAYSPGDRILVFMNGFNYYASQRYHLESYPGMPYDESVDWESKLSPFLESDGDFLVLLPIRRAGLASGLEHWLTRHGQLIWRRYATRYDYTVEGYQLFRVPDSSPAKDSQGAN